MPLSDSEFELWELDTRNDPYRHVVFEFDYRTYSQDVKTVGLSSKGWLSDTMVPYDNWVVGTPMLEESIDDSASLGTVQAINPYALQVATPVTATYSTNAPTLSSPRQGSVLDTTAITFTVHSNELDSSVNVKNNEARLIVGTEQDLTDVFDSGYQQFDAAGVLMHVVNGLPIDGNIIHVAVVFVVVNADLSETTLERYYQFSTDTAETWVDKTWQGEECRWRVGDVRWPLADHRTVARSRTESCRPVDGRLYEFNILSPLQLYDIPFTDTAEGIQTMTSGAAIDYALGLAGFSPASFVDAPAWKANVELYFEIEENHNLLSFLQLIADSLFCKIRVNPQTALIEFYDVVYNPNLATPVIITGDDIAYNSIDPVSVRPAHYSIVFNYSFDRNIKSITPGVSQHLSPTIEINSIVKQTINAAQVHEQYRQFYSVTRRDWELGVFAVQDRIKIGDKLSIEHNELSASGVVTNILREPIAPYCLIEVTV